MSVLRIANNLVDWPILTVWTWLQIGYTNSRLVLYAIELCNWCSYLSFCCRATIGDVILFHYMLHYSKFMWYVCAGTLQYMMLTWPIINKMKSWCCISQTIIKQITSPFMCCSYFLFVISVDNYVLDGQGLSFNIWYCFAWIRFSTTAKLKFLIGCFSFINWNFKRTHLQWAKFNCAYLLPQKPFFHFA